MLRRRVKDEKVNVRKAALHAIECAIRYEMPAYTKQVGINRHFKFQTFI